ncbi:MAG: sigma-70 family RNA polymerase sigma factor, partial [Burkholderiales bacterium]|nr:sigma-70 family RNA polymerase sigma factor [Phycisphaerae bacterium]
MPLSTIADDELLRQHLDEQSGAAMEELVRRHSGLVYSAAKRQVGRNDAADVSQAVFAILVKKAHKLRGRPTLGGWLVKATRYCAVDFMRKNSLNAKHERLAAAERRETAYDQSAGDYSAGEWSAHVAPQLDAALVSLSEADRSAVVLRFLQDHSFSEIAQVLKTTEEAARKRVTRALQKLQVYLSRNGVAIPAAAIGVGMAAQASSAAPASLVATIIGQTKCQALPASVVSI